MTEYFFQPGSFEPLSREEIGKVFPKFSPNPQSDVNVLLGKFKQPLISVFGGDKTKAGIQKKFSELGGSVRFGSLLGRSENLRATIPVMADLIAKKYHAAKKKIRFGISLFTSHNPSERKEIRKELLLQIKRECQHKGISMRFVNRNFRNLDAGTYWKEELWKEENIEFFVWHESEGFLCGETLAIQNIEEFAERDYGKPVRDMQTGMLPPKLALMMVNLARNEKGGLPRTIWDPFCGTGTILVEAQRLGVEILGSDKYQKMLAATEQNMKHFFKKFSKKSLFQYDVTKKLTRKMEVDTIVTEGYLGPICTAPVSESKFRSIEKELLPIYEGFFQNIPAEQVTEIVIALPFWRAQNEDVFRMQKILERVKDFGYTVRAFEQGNERGGLEFMRKNQIVGREIFCFEKVS